MGPPVDEAEAAKGSAYPPAPKASEAPDSTFANRLSQGPSLGLTLDVAHGMV